MTKAQEVKHAIKTTHLPTGDDWLSETRYNTAEDAQEAIERRALRLQAQGHGGNFRRVVVKLDDFDRIP